MGGSWDSNGGCFLFSLFSEVKSHKKKTGFLWRARLIRWFSFLIRAREGHVLCYTAPYTAVYKNGAWSAASTGRVLCGAGVGWCGRLDYGLCWESPCAGQNRRRYISDMCLEFI